MHCSVALKLLVGDVIKTILRLPQSEGLQQGMFFCSAVQTMRRRPPSGWAACQICNECTQLREAQPVTPDSTATWIWLERDPPGNLGQLLVLRVGHAGALVGCPCPYDHMQLLLVFAR